MIEINDGVLRKFWCISSYILLSKSNLENLYNFCFSLSSGNIWENVDFERDEMIILLLVEELEDNVMIFLCFLSKVVKL